MGGHHGSLRPWGGEEVVGCWTKKTLDEGHDASDGLDTGELQNTADRFAVACSPRLETS